MASFLDSILGSSGVPSSPTSQLISTSSISPWAQPYVSSYLQRAQQLSTSAPSAFQNQVTSSAQGMGMPEQFAMGTNLANQGGQGSLSTAPMALNYGQMGADIGQRGIGIGAAGQAYGMGAGANYAQQATNPSNLTKASNLTSSVVKTVGAPMIANVDLARAGVAQVTGNKTARNNALNSAKNNTLKIPGLAKDMAVGTVESSKQVGRGLAKASSATNNAQNAQTLLNDQLSQQRMSAINRAKQGFNSQQDINRFTNYADNLWGNSAESTQTQIEAQKEIQKQVDPIRNALAVADVGLTATSFGVAGATKAGASKVTASALEQNLAKNMAKDSALKAAQTAGRNEIIRQSGLTGSMGAFQGAISPYIVKDPGTVTTKDVIGGGTTGAVLGGVLPGAFVGASKFADPISKATSNVFKNNLNQGGYVQAGPTPKNIHFEDHGTMSDTIDMVKGTYNPTPKERYKLELDASRIGERYGITPIGNNKDPLVNLANGFQKRLDLDQANKVGMFAESGRPVSLNQQGSIPNPLQAFDKLKNKLNGSALDTTVKPATPENVYGVNAL